MTRTITTLELSSYLERLAAELSKRGVIVEIVRRELPSKYYGALVGLDFMLAFSIAPSGQGEVMTRAIVISGETKVSLPLASAVVEIKKKYGTNGTHRIADEARERRAVASAVATNRVRARTQGFNAVDDTSQRAA